MSAGIADRITEDIAELGLAEFVSPGKLRSLDGATELEFEEDGDFIVLFENGDAIGDYSTVEQGFVPNIMASIATSLNF